MLGIILEVTTAVEFVAIPTSASRGRGERRED